MENQQNEPINVTAIKFDTLKACVEGAVADQAGFEGEELDPRAADFEEKFDRRELPVLELFQHLGDIVSVEQLRGELTKSKAERTKYEIAVSALEQALYEIENPIPSDGVTALLNALPSRR